MTPDPTLFRDAIDADRRFMEAVRAPLEYRPLTEGENRLVASLEERMAWTTVGMLKALEAGS